MVVVNRCIRKFDWSQERFVQDAYGHYMNGHLVMPLALMPPWLYEGINLVGVIQNRIEEDRKD